MQLMLLLIFPNANSFFFIFMKFNQQINEPTRPLHTYTMITEAAHGPHLYGTGFPLIWNHN